MEVAEARRSLVQLKFNYLDRLLAIKTGIEIKFAMMDLLIRS